MTMQIRRATPGDARQLLEIYKPIVEQTAFSFELISPSEDEFAKRISSTITSHEWLVMTSGEVICGYAYATAHRARKAYRHSVETSVYVSSAFQKQGIGKKLYQELFASLRTFNYHNAYAGITLPNEGSVALHKSLDFAPIGVFREVGFKNEQWHDVSWWQRTIIS